MNIQEQYETFGYDAFLEYWVANNAFPSVAQCPARYMPEGPERQAYIRGWLKARDEAYAG